jgi:uncharacterized protein YdeI (YjbR/CyaY-like superfamily)
MDHRVDGYLSKSVKWQKEIERLRMIVLDCHLTEELKWGKPCYSINSGNVAIIFGFKEYCALGFFKGTLLKDEKGILVGPGENSQAMRQIRFTDISEINKNEALIKAYIYEAIEVEKAGLKVNFKKTHESSIPEEFQSVLDRIPELKTAFNALTPGRQRAYLLYFSQPKQSVTKISRIEKFIPKILSGKGLND